MPWFGPNLKVVGKVTLSVEFAQNTRQGRSPSAGWEGDGVTCSEVNECIRGTHNCDVNAFCTNNIGSFTCTCNQGNHSESEFGTLQAGWHQAGSKGLWPEPGRSDRLGVSFKADLGSFQCVHAILTEFA